MSAVTCIWYDGTLYHKYDFDILTGETVLEFCKRFGHLASLPDLTPDTSGFILIKYDDIIINFTDNRHRTIKEILDGQRTLFVEVVDKKDARIMGIIGGNLDLSDFMPDLNECSICLESYDRTSEVLCDNPIVRLPCKHRFHEDSIFSTGEGRCPTCRHEFDLHASSWE